MSKSKIDITDELILREECIKDIEHIQENGQDIYRATTNLLNKELEKHIKENYISKDKIITKIKELEEEIKKDKIEYDKEKNGLFKLAINRSMTEKIRIKKALEELLEEE